MADRRRRTGEPADWPGESGQLPQDGPEDTTDTSDAATPSWIGPDTHQQWEAPAVPATTSQDPQIIPDLNLGTELDTDSGQQVPEDAPVAAPAWEHDDGAPWIAPNASANDVDQPDDAQPHDPSGQHTEQAPTTQPGQFDQVDQSDQVDPSTQAEPPHHDDSGQSDQAVDDLADLFDPPSDDDTGQDHHLPVVDRSEARGPSVVALAQMASARPDIPDDARPDRRPTSYADTWSATQTDHSTTSRIEQSPDSQTTQHGQQPLDTPADTSPSVTGRTSQEGSKGQAPGLESDGYTAASMTPGAPSGDYVMDKMAAIADRADRATRLWPTVDRVMVVIGGDGTLQQYVAGLELTRDHKLDATQRQKLQQLASPVLLTNGVNITNPRDVNLVFDMVYDEILGISVLGPFWRDDDVTEIMANGWKDIRIELGGRLLRTPMRFRDFGHVDRVARELARKVSDRSLARNNPVLTAELPGARIAFAYRPIARDGVDISLRKFVPLLGMDALMRFGSLNAEVRDFLAETVGARCTTLISGGTGTGKTTLVNALSEFIPNNERVLTIEDAFELSLTNDHVVSLQTHERASADDETIIGQAELLVWALRARPDRIIVGEIREGDGALVMLQAATTGHEGTMTTIHANSAEAALNERFVDLVREASSRPDDVAKRSVAMALNLVIQVTRTPAGRRYISEISVVDTSCIVEGRIVPDPIFVGELDSLGVPQFRRVAHVRPETETGKKLNAYREEQAQR